MMSVELMVLMVHNVLCRMHATGLVLRRVLVGQIVSIVRRRSDPHAVRLELLRLRRAARDRGLRRILHACAMDVSIKGAAAGTGGALLTKREPGELHRWRLAALLQQILKHPGLSLL